jgi:hypothetical protein
MPGKVEAGFPSGIAKEPKNPTSDPMDRITRWARHYDGRCWRLVEAQHRVSTLRLTDSLDEQALLEDLIEETKPAVPAECAKLDYLLATPFRYGTYPNGSRFRRAGRTPGVFYASEKPETAVAETVFHRLLFFAESPATPWPRGTAEYTAFSTQVRVDLCLDLTKRPLSQDRAQWMHPTDYAECQALADRARDGSIEVIRYESVRDPDHDANIAVLTCRAFARRSPLDRRTWSVRLSASGAQAICKFPDIRIGFDRMTFCADPRIAALNWERKT